jgi:hypothetical protein
MGALQPLLVEVTFRPVNEIGSSSDVAALEARHGGQGPSVHTPGDTWRQGALRLAMPCRRQPHRVGAPGWGCRAFLRPPPSGAAPYKLRASPRTWPTWATRPSSDMPRRPVTPRGPGCSVRRPVVGPPDRDVGHQLDDGRRLPRRQVPQRPDELRFGIPLPQHSFGLPVRPVGGLGYEQQLGAVTSAPAGRTRGGGSSASKSVGSPDTGS